MIDRSDLVIFCVSKNSGGAYTSMKYAEKQRSRFINIADEIKCDVKKDIF